MILFHSWIACIGLPLPLIVSFFEDCYRCRCIELADNGDPISLGGLPCTLILTARIGPVYQLIAVGDIAADHHVQRGAGSGLESHRYLTEVKIDLRDLLARLGGDGVEVEGITAGTGQIGGQHLIVAAGAGLVKDTVIEPRTVGPGGQQHGGGCIGGDTVVPEEVFQRHVAGVGHREVVAHLTPCQYLGIAPLGDGHAQAGGLVV